VIRRLFADEADKVNEWFWRDSGKRGNFEPFLAQTMNVCLAKDDGFAMFVWRGPGIYEVHVGFTQRGKEVLRLAREMLDLMRKEHGAELFWAAVPIESRHVIIFTRLMGWKSKGFSEQPQGRCELFIGE
jgi:hypothetical protein